MKNLTVSQKASVCVFEICCSDSTQQTSVHKKFAEFYLSRIPSSILLNKGKNIFQLTETGRSLVEEWKKDKSIKMEQDKIFKRFGN